MKSYLENLKFDPKLETLPIAKYLTNFRYVLLLIITIISLGVFSFLNLPRRLNPEVKIPQVSSSTILPGAGPQDIEDLITIPQEDAVIGLDNVAKITSTSQENISILSVEFRQGTDPDRARDQVASAIDNVSLPQEAQEPNVQKLDFENQPVWQFIVSSETDTASLEQFAQILKDKIEKISTIKNVQVTGLEEQEIQILIKSQTLQSLGVDIQSIFRAVQASTKAIPAGNLNTQSSTFTLTQDPTITSTEDIRQKSININGQIVKLGDIATIVERSRPQDAKTYIAKKDQQIQRSVAFAVFKTESANIQKAVEETKKVTEEQEKLYENKFKIISVADYAQEIDKQFNELSSSFLTTIFLVIIVLFVFLGLRQALIVAFAIPLSFLVAFIVMGSTGISLNFLSLFSLILALGLLVDDAIVVVTAATSYWRTKKFTPNQTGLLVLRDFFVPIWSTTITAVWAFLPLLIASGIIGEFIKSIPVVVSTTLLASTSIAILITLPLMMVFTKPQFPTRVVILLKVLLCVAIVGIVFFLSKENPLVPINLIATVLILLLVFKFKKEFARDLTKAISHFTDVQKLNLKITKAANEGLIDSQKYANKYQNIINSVLNSKTAANKTLIIVVLFALFSYFLVPTGFVKNEFFPKTDQTSVYVSVELPTGTNLDVSEKEAKRLLEEFKQTNEVDYVTAEISRAISQESFFGATPKSNNILFTLILPKKEDRKQTSSEISTAIREKYKDYNLGKFSVIELSGGPPAGADVQIKLKGDDLSVLDSNANKISDFLKSKPNVTSVQKSIDSTTSKIVFVPDSQKLARYNLTPDMLGTQLRTFSSGVQIQKDVKITGQKQNIVFRTSSEVESPQNLTSVTIATPQGNIPLVALGDFVLKPNPTQISREDQKRTISVSAGVKISSQIQKENKNVQDFVGSLNLPEGYTWETGGVNEQNQESVNSILKAMLIAAILIASTMIIQFASYRKAAIVMLLIPLAISGVFIMFALTNTPLSFPTLIGILALFGIVVYQSMILLDKIERNIRSGMKLKHAISDAGASRVEPILFGTLTTVAGLVPITISDPLWRGLGGAIISGMLFSGIIMLLFIPVVYYKVFKGEIS